VRIALVVPHLGPGGAQKAVRLLAEQWAEAGIEVIIAVRLRHTGERLPSSGAVQCIHYLSKPSGSKIRVRPDDKGVSPSASSGSGSSKPPFGTYRWYLRYLAPHIPRVVNGLVEEVRHWIGRELNPTLPVEIARLRRTLRRISPDAAISFLSSTNVKTVLAAVGLGIPVIVNERNAVARQRQPLYVALLRAATYPFAAQLWTNTVENSSVFRSRPRRPLVITPNPLQLPEAPRRTAEQFRYGLAPRLLYIGRLVEQKNLTLLLDGFRLFAERYQQARLDILGDGSQRSELERYAGERGLVGPDGTGVRFHGWVQPEPWLAEGGIFLHTSRYEGTPNALLEAMAHALPAVVTEATISGMEADLRNAGVEVIESATPQALAAALERLCNNPERLLSYGERNRAYVERFEAGAVAGQLLSLVSENHR